MSTSDYGVIVTLPGYDWQTATPEQCAVHSKYSNPLVEVGKTPERYGSFTYSFPGSVAPGTRTNILTINHNLGYQPMQTCTWAHDYGASGPPVGTMYGDGNCTVFNFPWTYFDIYTTSTQFKIDYVTDPASAGGEGSLNSFTFRYYIFSESGL